MNVYTKKPRSIAEYAMMRGVTDFTNAAQFNLYETGYSHLCVISGPQCIEKNDDSYVQKMYQTFKYILEYEFRGLSGIEDISADDLEVTDGISTMNIIGKVNKQSASEVSMTFTEKSGAVITNFIRYYLEGIRDPRTQAKTYHGLIKNGILAPGFENEVFNFLYIVTDNTMLNLERAYLLCNAWPNKAETSIYESEKGSIDKKELSVTFKCFVIDGEEVNQRALKMLEYINEAGAVYNAADLQGDSVATGTLTKDGGGKASEIVHLQSDEYDYNVLASVDSVYATSGTSSTTTTATATYV